MSASKSQYLDYDKEQLLNALARFDGDIKVEDVTGEACLNYDSRHSHTVFLQILLEYICSSFVQNEGQRESLLKAICQRLAPLKIMHPSLLKDIADPIRMNIKRKFFTFVKEILVEVVPKSDIDPEALSYLENINISANPDTRFYKCFDELNEIGKGGFGVVFKAKEKLTEQIYAVKKIYFNYRNDNCCLRVMREARNIAVLDHPNVVRYYKSWVEIASSSSDKKSFSNDTDSKNSENDSQSFSAERVNALIMTDDCLSESSDSSRIIESNALSKSSYHYSNESSDSVIFAYSEEKYSEDTKLSVKESSKMGEDADGTVSEKTNSDNDTTEIENLPGLIDKLNLNILSILYIQMEYCDCDLRLWLEKRGKGEELPFEMDVTEIFCNILNGVAHIHSKGIIHRDLKPQNIFYSKTSHYLKIGDFGLATLANYSDNQIDGHTEGSHSSNIGTRPYAAPEQISSKCYNSKVDLYSLGIILIELMNTCSTYMEFNRYLTEVKEGNLSEEMKKLPELASLAPNLISDNPVDRKEAKDILTDFEEDTKVKLKEAKKALEEKKLEISKLNAVVRQKDKEIKRLKKLLKR